MVRLFIIWAVRRCPYVRRRRVVTFETGFLFKRFEFLWFDEAVLKDGTHWNRPPWWRPFNAFVHCWRPNAAEEMHDHPRWSITVCLKGRIIEKTPWGQRKLKPGSFVFRSRKYIHAFEVPAEHYGKTWTLFIVGRRNYRQNTYAIKSQ